VFDKNGNVAHGGVRVHLKIFEHQNDGSELLVASRR
jgi:hypothetical protein